MATGTDAPGSARGQALAWAQAARTTRRTLRHDLSNGDTTLPEVFERAQSEPMVGMVKLLFVLESLPGARKTDTRRALAHHGVDPDMAVGRLTTAERDRILGWFGTEAAR